MEQKKYKLYKELFPKEWKSSKTSLYRAGKYIHYSERLCEFFELVNEHCFPLLDYAYDDPDSDFEQFAIMPLNIDLCCEDVDFEYMRVSFVAGLIFYDIYTDDVWTFLLQRYGLTKRDLPEINRTSHPKVWRHKQSKETKPYSDLLKLIDHSTGNPWLDISHCDYCEFFEWNKETVEGLAKHYRQADGLFKTMEEVDMRLDTDPKKALTEMISYWNTGSISPA